MLRGSTVRLFNIVLVVLTFPPGIYFILNDFRLPHFLPNSLFAESVLYLLYVALVIFFLAGLSMNMFFNYYEKIRRETGEVEEGEEIPPKDPTGDLNERIEDLIKRNRE